MLGRSISSLRKPLKEVAKGLYEAEVRDGEIHNSFPMVVSYCCDIPEAKDLSAVWHGAERRQPRVMCHSTNKDSVRGRKTSSRVVAETFDTRREVEERQRETVSLGKRGLSTRRHELNIEIAALLS